MAPRCLGLAFVKGEILPIVLRTSYDVKTFTGDIKEWKTWLDKKHKHTPLTIVEDPKQFRDALRHCGTDHLLVLADYGWLSRRGVVCLDAEDRGDGVTILSFNPDSLQSALTGAEEYEPSVVDKWLAKGDPSGRCAGCAHLLTACKKLELGPAAKACDKWTAETSNKAYRTYNLCHLLHLGLRGTDDALLHELAQPREIWLATYRFALGQLPRKEWQSRYARAMRSAGTSKDRLKAIVLWVGRYGRKLAEGKTEHPPGKLDVKITRKLKKASKKASKKEAG